MILSGFSNVFMFWFAKSVVSASLTEQRMHGGESKTRHDGGLTMVERKVQPKTSKP